MILCSKMIVMSEKKMTSLLLYLFCLLNKKKHYTTSLLRESIKQSCKEEKGCSKFSDFLLESFIAIFLNKQEIWAFLFFHNNFKTSPLKLKKDNFHEIAVAEKKIVESSISCLIFFFSLWVTKNFFSFWKMSEKCMLLTGVSSFELQLQKTLQNKCIVGGKDFAQPASYLIIDFTRTIIHFSLTSSVTELRSSFDITLSLWYFMLLQIHTTSVNSVINQIDWLSNI